MPAPQQPQPHAAPQRPRSAHPERSVESLLEAGRSALRERDWEGARALFDVAAGLNSPEGWDGLAIACWGLQDAASMFEARGNAYRLYQAYGKRRDAARVAVALANDHLDFRGEGAVANGWLKRAARLLEGLDADPERAWLRVWQARLALASGQEAAQVLPLIEEALTLGRRAAVPDVAALALALRGMVRIADGELRDGMAELDEATITAVSGDMADPYAIGVTCCYLISACERTRDFDRAGQWCRQLRAYCDAERLAVVLTNCRLQYGGVLMAQGEWELCEAELNAALADAERARPSLLAAVRARLGELRRRQGRRDEAADLFARAGNHSVALVGGAALDLELGAGDAAAERAERYLRRLRPEALLERAAGLELVACIEAARGNAPAAHAAVRQIAAIAASFRSPWLDAAVLAARGTVASAEGDLEGSARLEDAADAYSAMGMHFEAASCQLRLATTLLDAGEATRAGRCARAAERLFRRIGSARAADAEALVRDVASRAKRRSDGPLTRREGEVLRLVADGLGNREIAERLVLSEHTIHRHLSNIRRKLGVSSRSAAVAHALRDGLL